MALPPKATATTAGEIILSGDLAGTGDLPQLANSGVTAGSIDTLKRVSIDAKGRITSAGSMSQGEVNALIDAAYATDPTKFTIVDGRPVLNFPNATTGTVGAVQIGTGFESTQPLTASTSSTSTLGIAKLGSGITITGDTVSVDSGDILNTTTGGVLSGFLQYKPGSDPAVLSYSSINSGLLPLFSLSMTNVVSSTQVKSVIAASSGSRIVAVIRPEDTYLFDGSTYTDYTRYVSATSTDGTNWTETDITFPSLPRGIAFGNGLFVTYGALKSDDSPVTLLTDSTIAKYWAAYSSDGVSWTVVNPAFTSTSYFKNIAFGNGRFVIPGINSTPRMVYAHSTDGSSWTGVSTTITTPAATTGSVALGVCFDGTNFCSFASNGSTRAVISGSDGVSWTDRSASFPSTAIINAFAVNGSGATMLHNSVTGVMYYSTNMSSWSTSTPVSITNNPLTRLDYVGSSWTATYQTTGGVVRRTTSTNGTGWSGLVTRTASNWYPLFGPPSIVLGSKYYVLEGTAKFEFSAQSPMTRAGVAPFQANARHAESPDGLTWSSGFGSGEHPTFPSLTVSAGFNFFNYITTTVNQAGCVSRWVVATPTAVMVSRQKFRNSFVGTNTKYQSGFVLNPDGVNEVVTLLRTSTDILVFKE